MITFSELGRLGRLGNQLFQFAILKVLSLSNNYEIALPQDLLDRQHHGQKCMLNYFKIQNINYINIKAKNFYFEKADWYFDDKFFLTEDDTNFFGFFQNQKYYLPFRKELIAELEIIDPIQEKINNIINKHSNKKVSLHIRRGDMTDGTNPSLAAWANDISDNSLMLNYYKKALSLIPSNSTIFLFTGGSRNTNNISDYNWCKKHFTDKRILFMDDLTDIETFCMIKSCDINITSFVSSFSWWASFLNKNDNVIAPLNYYPNTNISLSDLCPPYWKFI